MSRGREGGKDDSYDFCSLIYLGLKLKFRDELMIFVAGMCHLSV